MDHKVIGDGFAIIFHLRAENALTHKVGGAHHEQRHDHAHDRTDGAVWWRWWLVGWV